MMIKKSMRFTAMALAFGVLASAAFQGSNYLIGRTTGQTESEGTTGGTTATLNIADTVATSNSSSTDSSSDSMDVSAIAEAAMPSLVAITNTSVQEMQSMYGQNQAYESTSSGTGIIIGQTDTELLIATNNHVVSGADTLSVGFVDETVCEAYLKGADSSHDIAVIAVSMENIPEDTQSQIQVIQIGSSSGLKVGEQVVAIGNALGYGQSVTTGIVSALNREVTIDNVTNSLIQTDAAINPGNSGGALLNMDGQLIGINSAKYSDTDVEGMGYAIPVDDVIDIIEDLMNRTARTETVAEENQGFLGISGQDVTSEIASAYGMPEGIYVTTVQDGSAAAEAGLKKGDILSSFDGNSVSSFSDLRKQMAYYASGESVEITYYTAVNGEYTEQTATVTLGSAN